MMGRIMKEYMELPNPLVCNQNVLNEWQKRWYRYPASAATQTVQKKVIKKEITSNLSPNSHWGYLTLFQPPSHVAEYVLGLT